VLPDPALGQRGTFNIASLRRHVIENDHDGTKWVLRFPATGGYDSRPMHLEKTLSQIGDRLKSAREELRIVEEQLLFQMDVLEEAKTRMLVSETPLADREFRVARDDHERLLRQREDFQTEIAELQAEQDRLLDRMLGSHA
jgi:hypothetical protein